MNWRIASATAEPSWYWFYCIDKCIAHISKSVTYARSRITWRLPRFHSPLACHTTAKVIWQYKTALVKSKIRYHSYSRCYNPHWRLGNPRNLMLSWQGRVWKWRSLGISSLKLSDVVFSRQINGVLQNIQHCYMNVGTYSKVRTQISQKLTRFFLSC